MATKPQSDATLFVTADKTPDGQPPLPESVYGSRRAAKETCRLRNGKKLIRAVEFEPMRRERRFRVVELSWAPEAIINRTSGLAHAKLDEDTATRRSERGGRAYRRACKTYPLPTSLVDVPTIDAHGFNEYWAEKLLTRQAALKQAAELNAERLKGRGFIGQIVGADLDRRWFVVVELGKRVTVDLACVDLEETLLGVESRTIYRPVRLIRPSDDELATYPLPAECL